MDELQIVLDKQMAINEAVQCERDELSATVEKLQQSAKGLREDAVASGDDVEATDGWSHMEDDVAEEEAGASATANARLESLQQQSDALQISLEESQSSVLLLTEKLALSEQQKSQSEADLQLRLEAAFDVNCDSERRLNEAQEELSRVRAELQEARQGFEEREGERRELQDRIGVLEEAREGAPGEEEIAELRSQVAALQEEVNKQMAFGETMQRDRDEMKQALSERESEVQRLQMSAGWGGQEDGDDQEAELERLRDTVDLLNQVPDVREVSWYACTVGRFVHFSPRILRQWFCNLYKFSAPSKVTWQSQRMSMDSDTGHQLYYTANPNPFFNTLQQTLTDADAPSHTRPPRWVPTPGPMQAFLFNMASPPPPPTHTHLSAMPPPPPPS